jgi:hypothetical protein
MIAPLAVLAVAIAAVACSHTGKPSGPPPAQTEPRPAAATTADAQALTAFETRLREYHALHDRLEKTLPALPKEATSEMIDQYQRGLAKLISEHRASARQGEIFTREAERVIRARLHVLFSGPEGPSLKATIMDENPRTLKLAVNGRYPAEVPLSTMPPQVLAVLPKLPDHIEYRFIGPRLILLDVHAHTVVDYISNVLPT